ncbi:PHD finger domain protein [Aspergillus bombycis]|uniref:PHD finger domain protein n=1 Tax=Aspergillus bombycis TaxID=109264 RepID=A0A1F7ZKY0_9EURO|nr:PHD finger domain protein [Aspergillus bombycis]OGM40082.1 PHD finger domain protein [Aspergillus bombycis]
MSTSSSNASRSSTPSANGYSRVASPREHATIDVCRTLPALGPSAGLTQDLSNLSSPGVDRHQSSKPHGDFATPETHVLTRARNLLVDYGQLYADKDIRPELLLKLASMMTELEAQQSLQQEVQELRAENAALRNENANFRAYFTSRLPTNEPIINSSATSTAPVFPKLSSDTSGKSWDRIVMDLI